MIKAKKILETTLNILIICILCVTSVVNTVSAGGIAPRAYPKQDILFYDSGDTGCISNSSVSSGSSDTNTSPAGKDNEEIVAKFLTSTNFSGNGDKHMNAIQMAAIMGNIQAESGFKPNAGEGKSHQGIIQWSSGRWDKITDPKTDLDNQLNFIKTELDGSYKNALDEFWKASSPDDLNKATYAIVRNYEVAYNPGKEKSSTSWTNDADATDNVQAWTVRRDSAKRLYDTYGNLAGSESGNVPGAECGGLVSGGMTLEEAKKFMNEYKNLEPKNWPEGTEGTKYNLNGTTCSGGSLANCVAFSQYFINRYTTKKITSPGDGKMIVGQLHGMHFKDGGHTPKVYAVFSQSATPNNPNGHTGVVLGIDKDKGKIIIGEAGCGYLLSWAGAHEYNISEVSGDDFTYVYTDDLLKGGSL